jgi:ribosomal protein L37AE/L43A
MVKISPEYKTAVDKPVRWYHTLKLVAIRCPNCNKKMQSNVYLPGYDFWYCEDCKIIRD